jgi:hypothetical protein
MGKESSSNCLMIDVGIFDEVGDLIPLALSAGEDVSIPIKKEIEKARGGKHGATSSIGLLKMAADYKKQKIRLPDSLDDFVWDSIQAFIEEDNCHDKPERIANTFGLIGKKGGSKPTWNTDVLLFLYFLIEDKRMLYPDEPMAVNHAKFGVYGIYDMVLEDVNAEMYKEKLPIKKYPIQKEVIVKHHRDARRYVEEMLDDYYIQSIETARHSNNENAVDRIDREKYYLQFLRESI